MFHTRLRPIILILIPLLINACAGGSFDTQPVTVVNPDIVPDKPTTHDETTVPKVHPQQAEGIMQPALGYSIPIPRRNISFKDEKGKTLPDGKQAEEHRLLNPDDIRTLHSTDINDAPHRAELAQRQPGVRTEASTPTQRGYQFVHAGYLFSDFYPSKVEEKPGVLREGSEGYIFYQGRNPAQALPTGQTVRYSGHWDFVSDAKRHRVNTQNGSAGGGGALGFWAYYGDSVGATSFAETATAESDNPDLRWRARQHISEFEVDFANKKLTGELKRKHWTRAGEPEKTSTRYTLAADIRNNRFSGTVKAADKKDPIFQSDSALLEGGFYGGRGEELAGKFLADDHTLFGVFAAKQDKPIDAAQTEKLHDAYQINISSTEAVMRQPLPNFGDADKLLVDGEIFSLLPENSQFLSSRKVTLASGREVDVTVCCGNLDYLKFGHLSKSRLESDTQPEETEEDETGGLEEEESGEEESGEEKEIAVSNHTEASGDDAAEVAEAEEETDNGSAESGSTPLANDNRNEDSLPFSGSPYGSFLFIQGERTRSADMPQSGSVRYAGTWDGFSMKQSVWRTLPGNGASSGKARFDVDFASKQLSGSLTEHNGVRPAFLIDAAIQGNGFSGTVRTHDDGVNLDPGREGGSPILRFDNVPVKGGFYGPKATEIGGSFFSDEHKTGAVFGGKRQVSNE